MRSRQLDLGSYNTDKITNRYLERYDSILAPWVDKEIKLLEIGVYKGGSLLLWRDYFPQGTIVGVDIKLPSDFVPNDRIQLFEGSQVDVEFLSMVASKTAPEGFDIIIDDASHIGELTKRTFWHLFDNHLKPGGLYVVEDWGTGYWADWADGRSFKPGSRLLSKIGSMLYRSKRTTRIAKKTSLRIPFHCHNYGMVGFIKELVDEQGAHDLTRERSSGRPKRASKFESVLITPAIVFVKKASGSGEN